MFFKLSLFSHLLLRKVLIGQSQKGIQIDWNVDIANKNNGIFELEFQLNATVIKCIHSVHKPPELTYRLRSS